MFAQNRWNNEFGERVAFADMNGRQTAYTADRSEFIGRDGALDRPLALTPGAVLSNRVGPGLDPCGALQTQLRLNAGATTEIVFFLGQGATKAEAQSLVAKYRAADLDAVFADVVKQWDDMLGDRAGPDARPGARSSPKSLASLSDSGLPSLGPHRLLPGKRRLRIPRSNSGRAGLVRGAPGHRAHSSSARSGAAIRRRRCSALVVTGIGPRHPHAHQRRSGLASLCRRTLCSGHRRCRDIGRNGSLPAGAGAGGRRSATPSSSR